LEKNKTNTIMKHLYLKLLLCLSFFATCIMYSACNSSPTDTSSYTSHAYGSWDEGEEEEYNDYSYEEASYEDEVRFDDGTYSATVDYYNPNTSYSATYDLEVEVEDGAVTTIYFPNGGWLDEDHISPEELDEDGCCTIISYEGLVYEIQID